MLGMSPKLLLTTFCDALRHSDTFSLCPLMPHEQVMAQPLSWGFRLLMSGTKYA
jgi:hypothetical protein